MAARQGKEGHGKARHEGRVMLPGRQQVEGSGVYCIDVMAADTMGFTCTSSPRQIFMAGQNG